MRLTRNVALAAALSAILHLTLGWEWTFVPAVLAGAFLGRRGWLAGLLAVLLPWAGILAWSYSAAPGSTPVLLDVLGGLIGGNTPGAAVVALTLLFGALVGLAGGVMGQQMRAFFASDPAPARRDSARA